MHIRAGGGRKAAAGITALAVLGMGAAGAAAHIGGPGSGQSISTNGPDLRTVSVLDYNLGSTDGPRAKFCFDKEVTTVGAANLYTIFGYDSNRYFKPSTVAKASELNCVIATFPDNLDINQGTVGSVNVGAVVDRDGKAGDVGSEPLAGSVVTKRAGASTGPDLLSAQVDPDRPENSRTVTFTFDEPIPQTGKKRQMTADPNDGNATEVVNDPFLGSGFAYRNTAGDLVPGPNTAASVSVTGSKVTVNFGQEPGLSSATRLVAGAGAVQDRPENGSTGGRETWTDSAYGVITPAGAPAISAPEAQSAAPTGQQTYAITFSKAIAVNANTKARVVAISDDGSPVTVASDASAAGSTLNVVFPASVAADPDSIVGIGLLAGAVNDSSVANNPSIVGEVPLTPVSAGFSSVGYTSGPDLVSVGVDAGNRKVTYNYDEPVLLSSAQAGDFRAVTVDGAAAVGSGGLVGGGASVTVSYGADADAAVGYTNAYARLTDPTGRPNPIQSVSRDVEPIPVPTPIPTPTPTPNPTPTPTPKKKVKVKKLTLKTTAIKYTGTVSADSPCKSGRTVTLKIKTGKKTKTIAKTKTSSKGTFSFRRTSKTKGKKGVYVVIGAKSTSTVSCTVKSSPKKKG